MNIAELNLLGCSAVNSNSQVGYGYVYAFNGAVQSILNPITISDFQLAVGKSVKLLFPGCLTNQQYILSGGFAVGDDTVTPIPVTQTGTVVNDLAFTDAEHDTRANFALSSGKIGSATGTTVDVVFGGKKPICKIVVQNALNNITVGTDGEAVGIDDHDADGVAYLFSSLSQAVAFAQTHSLSNTVIELLIDYLIPGDDLANIPNGLNLAFTTAIGDTEEDYNYSSDPTERATISRDNSNTGSFIVVANGNYNTKLTVQNLVFDGKNFSGNIAGGVIKTKNCEVEIRNCTFQNCVADDGGGIKVEFAPDETNYTKAKLSVIGCNFINCKSKGAVRQGGGAIWTNACTFILAGEKDANGNYVSGVFDSCTSSDQGGAVFHRIDWVYPQNYRSNSSTTISTCKFINCQAKAAGGLELDSYNIEVNDSWIENCQAFLRNAGGFNVYIQYKPNNNPNENDDANPPVSATGETKLTLNRCTIKDCTATQIGGGFRTLTHATTLTDCTFTNNTAGNNYSGGGIAITNLNATVVDLIGCTVQNCSAKSGGGISVSGASATLTIKDDPVNKCESIISGNIAYNQGGGLHTNSATTLINTKIQNNSITNGTVDNAAGMYINGKTLTIGKTGADEDTTIISDNTASGGVASNLHLWGGSNASSIVVNCDLSVGSHIGVTNPGNVTQQFGTSPNSTTTPFWRPYGLADPTPDDPDYYPTFVADNGSVYGIIDRSDESGKRIIWGGPPACKITDASGNLLYLDNAKKYPAIFDALEGGTAGKWTSAFSVLGVANPKLYSASGNLQTDKTYQVQMLIEEYQLGNTVTTYTVPNTGTPLDITLTTASANDSSYPYRGTTENTATIIRKSGFKNSMFSVGTKLTFKNIVLDGGSANNLSTTTNGSVLNIYNSRYSAAILKTGAVIKNSKTTGLGTVYVDWGDFTLAGGTIENCTAKNGGAVYMKSRRQTNTPDRGYFRFTSGNIQNCTATESGGGIYVNTGAFNMTGGKIQNCKAEQNGGGICFMSNGQSPTTDEFTLSNGAIISNCQAATGGGVYVNAGKTMKMESAFIIGNSANTKGGGIAIGGNNTKLIFSKTPWVSGNICNRTDIDSEGNACNLELDSYADAVIQTNGIWNGAKIGVYVPGNRDDAVPGNDTDPYKNHGGEGDRFGTFNSLNDSSYLYGFVNDRNGLKGGLQSGTNPNNYKGIHWIKIFSLEVSKNVIGQQNDQNEEFAFKVTLTGKASDGTVAEDINSTNADPEKYGGLYFVNGVATQMVVIDGNTARLAPLKLKSGDSVTGERLPPGLNYTVEELLTDDQKQNYSSTPDEKIYGYIGENAESTTQNRYLSIAAFTNLRPICKITNTNGTILYYKTAIDYNWNENGSFAAKHYDHYLPAVYLTLEDAIDCINAGTTKLYFQSNNSMLEYTEKNYRVEMLTDYNMVTAETIDSGKTITLQKASNTTGEFPYRGKNEYPIIARGNFNGLSMFTVNGELILTNIVLDGSKGTHSGVTANGGIVNVRPNGAFAVQSGAILRNSATAGNGGAAYVSENAVMTMNAGTINLNEVRGSGAGAGIYLEENAEFNISGNPYFGGTGAYNDGSTNLTIGNIKAGTSREDIYIAGYASESSNDTSAASLVVNGNITSGNGTIWVWAAESPHYKSLCQFAKYSSDVTDKETSFATFRNAREDAVTGADQVGRYLYGITKTDDAERNVFWYGIDGSAHVTLVKVQQAGASYKALSGKTFTVYTDRGNNVANGTRLTDSGTEEVIKLENLPSGLGGAFFIGELSYGTYFVGETGETGYFEITIDKGGVVKITDETTDPKTIEPVKTVNLR